MKIPQLILPTQKNQEFFNRYYYKTFWNIIIETLTAFYNWDIDKYKKLKSLEINLIILRNSWKKITYEEYITIRNFLYSSWEEIKWVNELINYILYKIEDILVRK